MIDEENDYSKIEEYVFQKYGININKEKRWTSNIKDRIDDLNLGSVDSYLEYIKDDEGERSYLIDCVTTNKTYFFREHEDFDFLENYFDNCERGGHRIWSAACSTGEETYSLAMIATEKLGRNKRPPKILGTDINSNCLEEAVEGEYERRKSIRHAPEYYKDKYIDKFTSGSDEKIEVDDIIKDKVLFRRFNLTNDYSVFDHDFDIIFCRNVLIYFDEETTNEITEKMSEVLAPGGYLITGSTEHLNKKPSSLTKERTSLYRKKLD